MPEISQSNVQFGWPEAANARSYSQKTDVAKALVASYFNSRLDRSDRAHMNPMLPHEPYVVWFNFTLGNWKALLSTNIPDGMYYEVTYDKATDHIYLDAYRKQENVQVARVDGMWTEIVHSL